MDLQRIVREWLGIDALRLALIEKPVATPGMIAGMEKASRDRHQELLERMAKLESMLIIEAPRRKVRSDSTMYSLEEDQAKALQEMEVEESKNVQLSSR
jgi:hypothetical protein